WWLRILQPILREFVEAAEGRPDTARWRSIYKYRSFSGGNAVTGWIMAFFPYLKDPVSGLPKRRNPWLAQDGEERNKLLYPSADEEGSFVSGPAIDQFPIGLTRAPLLWRFPEREFNMEFLGGFVGVTQDAPTLCLRPEIGWVVCEEISRKRKPPYGTEYWDV